MRTTGLNIAKPNTALLVGANAICLTVYMLHDVQNALQMYFTLPILVVLLAISSLYHAILWLCTRKKELKSVVKIPLYLLPVILLVSLNTIIPGTPELPNQQPKLASYDGRYTMKMDMKHNRWIVSIYDAKGEKLYSDDSSDFHGQFNVYWIWDRSNRLWLYNSDDGLVYYWIRSPKGWKKICWSSESDKSIHRLYPPKALYPTYEKGAHMKLPKFRYHPDPIATGSIVESDKECICCGNARGYIYTGPVYAVGEYDDCICPWCIADGSAHERLGASFTDECGIGGYGTWDDVPKEVIEEVAYRTPGYCAWQQAEWYTHCGDAGQFLGFAGYKELKEYGSEAIASIRESTGIEDESEWQQFFAALDKDGSPTAYIFRCSKCGKLGGYQDYD